MRRGVLLIIRNLQDNYLLVQHTKDNKWGFVSGGLEISENEVDAIVRETEEEIGVILDKDKLVRTGLVLEFMKSGERWRYDWYEYDVSIDKVESLPNPLEIKKVNWFSTAELENKISDKPLLLQVFRDYLRMKDTKIDQKI